MAFSSPRNLNRAGTSARAAGRKISRAVSISVSIFMETSDARQRRHAVKTIRHSIRDIGRAIQPLLPDPGVALIGAMDCFASDSGMAPLRALRWSEPIPGTLARWGRCETML
jgi:hypothetical protein